VNNKVTYQKFASNKNRQLKMIVSSKHTLPFSPLSTEVRSTMTLKKQNKKKQKNKKKERERERERESIEQLTYNQFSTREL
jgi:hypothetical protein